MILYCARKVHTTAASIKFIPLPLKQPIQVKEPDLIKAEGTHQCFKCGGNNDNSENKKVLHSDLVLKCSLYVTPVCCIFFPRRSFFLSPSFPKM